MGKPEHTKPFCAKHAQAGAPFSGEFGEAVRVLIWNRKHPSHPIVLMEEAHDQEVVAFKLDGTASHGMGSIVSKLVMLPLGMIDDKPVFVGDAVINQLGVEIYAWPNAKAEYLGGCTWPTPATAYPVTQMTSDDFSDAMGALMLYEGRARAVANAALRHAIDAGQVVTKADHDAAVERGAERDMDIADAVRAACIMECSKSGAARQIDLILENIVLAGIIAKVPK